MRFVTPCRYFSPNSAALISIEENKRSDIMLIYACNPIRIAALDPQGITNLISFDSAKLYRITYSTSTVAQNTPGLGFNFCITIP